MRELLKKIVLLELRSLHLYSRAESLFAHSVILAAKEFTIRAILATVECAARGAGPPGLPVLPGPARRGSAAALADTQ